MSDLILILGVAAAGAVLTLARVERASLGPRRGVANPLADALATFFAWTALFGLALCALYRFGLVPAAVLAALVLGGGRLVPPRPWLAPAFPWKLTLSVAALVAALVATLGLLSTVASASPG